jgi:hypothetical protein
MKQTRKLSGEKRKISFWFLVFEKFKAIFEFFSLVELGPGLG